MADDKRSRGDPDQGGKPPGTDRQRRDRKSDGGGMSGGGMESPDRGSTGSEDEQEPKE
jgi:hypothetical protein